MRTWLWAIVLVLLPVLSIPWFMWGEDGVWAGLPVWVWWHVAWMGVAAVAFALFARRAWDRWIAEDGDD